MKKLFNIFAAVLLIAAGLCSCVDEEGAGVPAPKSMFVEAEEYDVNVTTDEVQTLVLRWIDVENATYQVTFSNAENDIVETLSNSTKTGDLHVISMDIPYSQLAAYVEKAGLNGIVGCDFFINITGKPIDASQPTALDAEGSTVQATVHYVE